MGVLSNMDCEMEHEMNIPLLGLWALIRQVASTPGRGHLLHRFTMNSYSCLVWPGENLSKGHITIPFHTEFFTVNYPFKIIFMTLNDQV